MHERLGASRPFWLAVVVTLLAANQAVFDVVFGISFVGWYVEAGVLIGLVSALISSAVELDDFNGLVAADPGDFAKDARAVVGLAILGLPLGRQERPRSAKADAILGLPLLIEIVLAVAVEVMLLIAVIGWLLVIAPAQYVTHLVCGAPARHRWGRKLVYARPAPGVVDHRTIGRDEEIPKGMREAGFSSKPVTFTTLASAAVLFALAQLL